MWNKILGFNTLVLWPATGIFLTYSIGRALLYGDWALLGMGIGLFVLAVVVQVLLGTLSDR
jgi:hypothetical protein